MKTISYPLLGVLVAATLSLVLLAALVRQRQVLLRSRLFIAISSVQTVVLLLTGWAVHSVDSGGITGPPGSVGISAGGGSTGCVVNVSGNADLPAGRDAWLFLTNEHGDYYAQGGRPIMEGPSSGKWSFPAARVANKFYQNAKYTWLAVVVSTSTSNRLQGEVSAPANDNWQLPADKFPLDEQVSARASADLLLSSDTGCGG